MHNRWHTLSWIILPRTLCVEEESTNLWSVRSPREDSVVSHHLASMLNLQHVNAPKNNNKNSQEYEKWPRISFFTSSPKKIVDQCSSTTLLVPVSALTLQPTCLLITYTTWERLRTIPWHWLVSVSLPSLTCRVTRSTSQSVRLKWYWLEFVAQSAERKCHKHRGWVIASWKPASAWGCKKFCQKYPAGSAESQGEQQAQR